MAGPGLRFRKLDLHVHTPASKDFDDKSVTADQIVDQAIEAGLDAIAITDHNTGEWIDLVQKAASKKGLVVFPGVEISCFAGTGGIHLIALFDEDKDSNHVENLLSALGIPPDKQGDIEAMTDSNLGITAIIDIIQNSTWQGLAVPAHVTSAKGILDDIRGNPRTEVIQHPTLIAVEATCFQNEELKNKNKRAVDLLDGNDPIYRRMLAVYQASDNPSGTDAGGHGLAGIGKRFTNFKMEKINLDSLKQCFLDPDVRINQDLEYQDIPYPRITSVSISGGFLQDQTAHFNAGLNSIVGGKGTGKSLLIELMRFALDQSPERSELSQDHRAKLANRLIEGNCVELEFTNAAAQTFSLKRTYRSDGSSCDTTDYDPSQLFPVLFLSQNEIIRIAECENEQLKFIDQFFDFRTHEHTIQNIERSLRESDNQLAQSIRATREHFDLERRIATDELDLSSLEEQLSHKTFTNYKQAEQQNQVIDSQVSSVVHLLELLTSAQKDATQVDFPEIPDSLLENDRIARIQERISKAKETAITQLTVLRQTVTGIQSEITLEQNTWSREFQNVRSEFDEHLRNQGVDFQELEERRATILHRIEDSRRQLQHLTRQKEALPTIRTARKKTLDDLEQAYVAYRTAREIRCDQFQTISKGKLRLSIGGASNAEAFKNRLMELKTGSYLHEHDIDAIASKVQPREFVASIMRNYMEAAESSETLTELANKTGVSLPNIQKLTDVLISNNRLEVLLELQYKVYPQDRLQIEFLVGKDRFSPLHSLSVGQKSTALLIIALSDGKMPVVIDQPEDSLDIRSIWKDICSNLRTNKSTRQFIFTTHNSTFAVASDSDNFIILEADSENGRIIHNGSMDHSSVSKEVLTYMEGGLDPYHIKSAKYGVNLRTNRN
ncbi:MAG: AAA family ATPase [Anaerolineaceae bacterium]|nr:AAA family ATPase [Anaerolineaceae bacterium]